MLHREEFIAIGHIRKSHGYQGHARVEIEEGYEEDFASQEFLFLEIDRYKVPFYIVERIEQRHLIVKLEHIDNPEALLPFHQTSIYLLKKDLITPDKSTVTDKSDYIVGMTIWDTASDSEVGKIVKVEEYPQQMIAFVNYQNTDVMIPIHEDLISELDTTAGILYMELPEGLLDVQG